MYRCVHFPLTEGIGSTKTYDRQDSTLPVVTSLMPCQCFVVLQRWYISYHDVCRYAGFHLCIISWWRHQMETFSALLAICVRNSPVIGEFPSQMPVTRSFDVFLDLRQNKRFRKQWWGCWFESHRAHYDVTVMSHVLCKAIQQISLRYQYFGCHIFELISN